MDGQLGLERTPEEYVERMVAVFREVRRVLREDGTMFVNMGDCYATGAGKVGECPGGGAQGEGWKDRGVMTSPNRMPLSGLKPKDLVGMPWTLAKALQAPYYSGQISSERDRIWLAAIIDGEGSISGFRHVRKDDGTLRTGVTVNITNSNRALLDECNRIWPTSREQHNAHGLGHLGKLPTWRWIPHSVNAKAQLMRELYPYIVGKKKQVLLAWNFFELSKIAKRLARQSEAPKVKEKRDWIMGALSRLNHLEAVDIPEWIIEPPGNYEPGWYLRSEIIWAKPNPMPESVTDRPTKSHEQIFLLTKAARYYYDAEAVREPAEYGRREQPTATWDRCKIDGCRVPGATRGADPEAGRNLRTVWTIATEPFPGAHFATFPKKLVEPCVLAGTSERGCCAKCGAPWERVVESLGPDRPNPHERKFMNSDAPIGPNYHGNSAQSGLRNARMGSHWIRRDKGWQPSCACGGSPVPCTVLDPFCGSGTVGLVALRHGRDFVGIELNPKYVEMAKRRIVDDAPLFNMVSTTGGTETE